MHLIRYVYDYISTQKWITTEKSPWPGKKESFEDLFHAAKDGSLHNLSKIDCVNEFSKTYQQKYSKLLLATDDVRGNDSYALIYTNPVYKQNYHVSDDESSNTSGNFTGWDGPFDWMCPYANPCETHSIPDMQSWATNDRWFVNDSADISNGLYGNDRPTSFKVNYCLAKEMPQHCKLQYSLPITLFVIAFNIVKTVILLYMWLGIHEAPILTIGDAIASFLRYPDPYSQGRCLLTGRSVRDMRKSLKDLPDKGNLYDPVAFANTRRLFASAASTRRWAFSVSM